MSDAPPPEQATPGTPTHRVGAARSDAVPRMENVRVPEPDLFRRAALEKTRTRLVYAAFGFGLLFLAVVAKLADATILQPLAPHRPERPIEALFTGPKVDVTSLAQRAMITSTCGLGLLDTSSVGESFSVARSVSKLLRSLAGSPEQ